ncbi:helix-turn-helix domain-containing protein [Pedobacter sp.]|uniref:helix-turn-helix domain-containing protein n=1 Tax=Pedobacter sp. TaxID=1411316 RepID=UPI003D7F64E9
MRFILFSGAVQGLFMILLLRSKTRNQQADYWLMAWLLLVSMQLLFYFDNLYPDPLSKGIFGIIAFSIPLLSAPVLFQYVCSISFNTRLNAKRIVVYLVPWLVYIILTIGMKMRYPSDIVTNAGYPHFGAQIPDMVIYLFTIPMAVIPGIYAVMGYVVLLRYQKSLPECYSYTEKINLNWLKWLVLSILLLFILLFIFIRFGRQIHLVSSENLFMYVGTSLSLYVFLIGYLGLQQSTLMQPSTTEMTVDNITKDLPYKKSGLDDSSVGQLYQLLLDHMEQHKPFLNDDLSLSMLASQISLNPNQLSQVINQKSGNNFFVFVNTYRVEEVKKRLLDSAFSHLSILGIAYDCGFRSKSAFNRIFKAQVGLSPLEYQRENNHK